MTPEQYCRDKLEASGSSFRSAFRLMNPSQRRALEAIYAYCREVDDLADDCSDPGVASMSLAWWGEELGRVGTGEARHPVGQALQAARQDYALALDDLEAVLRGVQRDLRPQTPASWEAFDIYCDEVAGAVGRLSAVVFEELRTGRLPEALDQYAGLMGLAFQATNILRDVGEDARRSRVYLPIPLLKSHGLTPGEVLRLEASAAMEACLRELAGRAHGLYDQAIAALDSAGSPHRRRQRPGLMMAMIYRDLLRAIEEDPLLVLRARVSLGAGRKAFLALKARLGFLPR